MTVFGPWWLPRLALGLVGVALLIEIAGMTVFAAHSWLAGIVVFGAGVLISVAGTLMWGSYRMRHWLPDGVASGAPLASPVALSTWAWAALAAIVCLAGIGLMLWLMATNGSPPAVFFGIGILSLSASASSATLISLVDRISPDAITVLGLPARRLSVVMLAGGLILAAGFLMQAQLLPPTR